MAFKLRMLDMKTKQVVILAGLHVMSRDFSDEFPCSGGIRVIHKISVTIMTFLLIKIFRNRRFSVLGSLGVRLHLRSKLSK